MIEPWKDPPELFNAQISRSKAVQALALPVPGVREVALPFLPLVFSLALLLLRAKHYSGGPLYHQGSVYLYPYLYRYQYLFCIKKGIPMSQVNLNLNLCLPG